MNTTDIIKEAKARLAEIEAEQTKLGIEATKLRAMVAAAEGTTVVPMPERFLPPIAPSMPYIPTVPTLPWTPNVPWPLDRVTCGSTSEWLIDLNGTRLSFVPSDTNVLAHSGVISEDYRVYGGPQRMDPTIRFKA